MNSILTLDKYQAAVFMTEQSARNYLRKLPSGIPARLVKLNQNGRFSLRAVGFGIQVYLTRLDRVAYIREGV